MRILHTYTPETYYSYKKEILSLGGNILSVSQLPIIQTGKELTPSEKHIVDLSSLAASMKDDRTDIFAIEKILDLIDEDVTFVVDIKYRDQFLYGLRHIFSSSEPINTTLIADASSDADIIASITHPVKRIIDLNEQEVVEFFNMFNSKLYGHDRFKAEFKKLVTTFRVFNKIGEHKILSLFLMGDSGVGKTEVARCINRSLNPNSKLAKINFGNYSSHDSLNSLIGSPLGYIGSDGGELVKRVTQSDAGLVLIDEFEKANIAVFNYFLDVLESGKITNSQADEVDINGYIIIFTSNTPKASFATTFSPELRSRFDYKGTFNLLTNDDKTKYTHNRINEILTKYNEVASTMLPQKVHSQVFSEINVTNYKNMRDLNKKIKDVFVKYVSIYEKNKYV